MIVDYGSTNRTPKVAFGFVMQHKIVNVRVLLGRNHGKGEAVRKMSVENPGYPVGLRFQTENNWCFHFLCVEAWSNRESYIHSHGELLLMLDANGATKVTDLEKLEA